MKSEPLERCTNDLGMTFVRIPPGTVTMGKNGYKMTSPEHTVSLDSFWISAYETTNEQYEKFRKHHKRSDLSGLTNGPVGNLQYKDIRAFIQWISNRDGLRYELPTEAQWEYAAHGGMTGDYPWGNENTYDPATGGKLALVSGLQCKPVGSYPPNGYGLFDMCGNMPEMVREAYYYYPKVLKQSKNPTGPIRGSLRLLKGWGVASVGNDNEIWNRLMNVVLPDYVGFRLIFLGSPNHKFKRLAPLKRNN